MKLMLFLLFLGLLGFGLVIYFTRKATIALIKTFYDKNALSHNEAVSLQDLGIEQRSAIDQMVKMPDYKPYALNFLMQQNIVYTTDDKRYYLSEKGLSSFIENSQKQKEGLNRIETLILPPNIKG